MKASLRKLILGLVLLCAVTAPRTSSATTANASLWACLSYCCAATGASLPQDRNACLSYCNFGIITGFMGPWFGITGTNYSLGACMAYMTIITKEEYPEWNGPQALAYEAALIRRTAICEGASTAMQWGAAGEASAEAVGSFLIGIGGIGGFNATTDPQTALDTVNNNVIKNGPGPTPTPTPIPGRSCPTTGSSVPMGNKKYFYSGDVCDPMKQQEMITGGALCNMNTNETCDQWTLNAVCYCASNACNVNTLEGGNFCAAGTSGNVSGFNTIPYSSYNCAQILGNYYGSGPYSWVRDNFGAMCCPCGQVPNGNCDMTQQRCVSSGPTGNPTPVPTPVQTQISIE